MAKPDFDSIKHLNPYNVEYWEARELMPLLGYGNKWQNFVDVIKKAMISCETTGNIVTDHFTGVSKMVGYSLPDLLTSSLGPFYSRLKVLPIGVTKERGKLSRAPIFRAIGVTLFDRLEVWC